MTQKRLSILLKIVIIGMTLCGLGIYLCIFPDVGPDLIIANIGINCYVPWLIFAWITAIPCFAVLFFGWGIAADIGKGNVFTRKNAVRCKRVMNLIILDTVLVFFGNILFLILDMSLLPIFECLLLVCFGGVALSVFFAALYYYIGKASDMQEENQSYI